ncbi:MAG TPA: phytoene/squalene synthase family protein [Polyangiaceae bacterium]|nr:phytoene/squalene synthase family protein [Polyangiaceae bacterium]
MNAALAPLPLEAEAAHVIAQHSKSFALASRILPRACRAEVHVLYAWCRRADDLVDLQGAACARRAVLLLGRELDGVYAGRRQDQPLLAAFQRVVLERSVPREYPAELIAGLSMDAEGTRYETLGDLHRYCYRVAGTVGLMMAHVLGARDARALRPAAHLGMAMQLTNICRDVTEDWQRGRLYLPAALFPDGRAPAPGARRLGAQDRAAFAAVVAALLDEARAFYRSADVGLQWLPWRAGLAVRAARRVYAAIGERIAGRRCDVFLPRAIVPAPLKWWLLGTILAAEALRGPWHWLRARGRARLADGGGRALAQIEVRFPHDVLPL